MTVEVRRGGGSFGATEGDFRAVNPDRMFLAAIWDTRIMESASAVVRAAGGDVGGMKELGPCALHQANW